MLSSRLREAEEQRAMLEARASVGSSRVASAAVSLVDSMKMSICEEVDAAYEDQKLIEREIRRLQGLLQSNAHQNDRWVTLLSGVINELKELGDVSNWAQLLADVASEIHTVASHINEPAYAELPITGRSNTATTPVSDSL